MFKRGVALVVEAAVDPHGRSIVVSQLDRLRNALNKRHKARYYDLNERFAQLAAYGELEIPREMRKLSGELWEIKTASDRLPFYRKGASPAHQLSARLTFLFEKSKGKTEHGRTPRKHIDRGLWIMKGDMQRGKINAAEIING